MAETTDETTSGETTSGGRIAFAVMSALWLILAGFLLCFMAALGTLACGAICDVLVPIGMAVMLIAVGGLIVAVRLIVGALRRRITPGLMRLALIADGAFVLALVGVLAVLGSG